MRFRTLLQSAWVTDPLLVRRRARRRAVVRTTIALAAGGLALAGVATLLARRWPVEEPLSDDDLREIEAFEQYERERLGQETPSQAE